MPSASLSASLFPVWHEVFRVYQNYGIRVRQMCPNFEQGENSNTTLQKQNKKGYFLMFLGLPKKTLDGCPIK